MEAPRYLTKSRFKLAVECPTKLFYTNKPTVYADAKADDEFLQALADGGFQVGELAKVMFPGGIEIRSPTHDEQVQESSAYMQQDDVILFEAAIRHGGLFARVDVLRRVGATIDLIEVKAKSYDPTDPHEFRGARGKIKPDWLPYLQDVAFQRYVFGLAFPGFTVRTFLMLVDKSKACSIDGLNQRFKVKRTDGRPAVILSPGTDETTIGNPILTCVPVGEFVDEILTGALQAPGRTGTVTELLDSWVRAYQSDSKIDPVIGSHCAKCEFQLLTLSHAGLSGFDECWSNPSNATRQDLSQGTVLDLWSFRGKQKLIENDILRLPDVTKEDLKYTEGSDGLSPSERQWMQVSNEWPGGGDFFLDRALMRRTMASWVFPLHFIDFETATVAIPFFKGHRPYEMVAFQFSHHVVEPDGRVSHRSEYLNATPGANPSYEFVRQLKQALGDEGSVFMWSHHENTTLNTVLRQLEADENPPSDSEQLKEFIRSVTVQRDGSDGVREGARAMIDLCRLATLAFFHPATKGSNSIKKVLPAVLQSSDYLKDRYSGPIYGAPGGIPSSNFNGHAWWQQQAGQVVDPYRLLPPVFTDLPPETGEKLESAEDMQIAEGGAATTAYARLQFEELPSVEREAIESALLKYCELDTLAMVMIYEAWREWC
jgi:hypothetical protein